MAIGVVIAGTPAGAHVGGSVGHLWNHLKPSADNRYLPGKNLPPGKTMKGSYMVGAMSSGGTYYGLAVFSFPQQLAANPIPHYMAVGATPTAQCPGSNDAPAAAPGHLCIYENAKSNVATFTISDPARNLANTSGRWGAYIQITAAAAGLFYSNGTWAVTAPNHASPAPRPGTGTSGTSVGGTVNG
jgi:hypothetical protein